MLELDGEAAGGQFLRSALSVAAVENRPVRIENVRGDRSPSGLRPQHLAAVEALATICDADVEGAERDSETVTFDPTREESAGISGGEYAIDIETAGSVTLVLGAVLPLAARLAEPIRLSITGGTDVKWSPPLAYLQRVKLPLLRRFGLQATVDVDRRGFYPAGGGRVTLTMAPSTIAPIRLTERGPLRGIRCYSAESASLADRDVAARQLDGFENRLESASALDHLPSSGTNAEDLADRMLAERTVTTAVTDSPGSAIVSRLDFEHATCGTSALGERGTPAERVGERAAQAAISVLESSAPVDDHLADQLLIWLALAGGRVRIPRVTDHVESSLSLLSAVGYAIDGPSASDERSTGRHSRDEWTSDKPTGDETVVVSAPGTR